MSDPQSRFEQSTIGIQQDPRHQKGPGRCYLLVFDGGSSARFNLPSSGEVIIGRAKEADLLLKDQGASRRHARLLMDSGSATLTDLESHNGTRVNGERITAPRALTSGDVISIGDAALCFHRDAGLPHPGLVRDEAELRRRLEEEVARALRGESPLAVLCVDPGTGALDHQGLLAALSREYPAAAVASSQGHFVVLLPEVGEDEIEEVAARLLLAQAAPQARLGHATCPADGGDADTLLSGVREAVRAAAAGQAVGAAATATTRVAGGRTILIADQAMARLYTLVSRLAQGDLPVLVLGETGAGKEVVAAALHEWSPRKEQRLVSLNCAALPESLVEGELFGYEKGAFSGAAAAKPGLLESAHLGTVFLDEVGELPAAVQAKLLRVLETRQVTRLGALRERAIDIRIVAATHRDLEQEVNAGRFRQDLFFRLGVATVVLPPLRDRTRELPLLARMFLEEACARARRPPMTISAPAMQRLLAHGWPGNLRELRNVMELCAATVTEPVLAPWHLPARVEAGVGSRAAPVAADPATEGCAPGPFKPIEEELRELERRRMEEALRASSGQHNRAAELISMPLRTFSRKVKLYGLSTPPAKKG